MRIKRKESRHVRTEPRDDAERRGPLSLGVILSVVLLALIGTGVWGLMALWSHLQHMP